MKKIITVGSCMSINTAHWLEKYFNKYQRISSTQHCRIDYLYETFVSKNNKIINRTELSIKEGKEENVELTLYNQEEPGYAGIKKSDNLRNIIKAIKTDNPDILILDNFADIIFKLIEFKSSKQFLNKNYFNLDKKTMKLTKQLTMQEIFKYYNLFIEFVREYNPEIKIQGLQNTGQENF